MNFSTVRIEGGLLPAELLEQVALCEAKGQRPEDFGLEKNRRLTDEIAAAWSDARAYWDALQRALRRVSEHDPATTPTREQWVVPLLRSLGYTQVTTMRSAALIEGQTFFVSHRAGESDEALPVHIVGIGAKLDERPASGRPRLSPHALVQEYLNRTDHVWGVVTNGSRLRLLRDTSRMTRPSYVEFDLEAMLAGEKFAEFGVFYRLLHRTRLPQGADDAAQCLLEGYYQEGIEQGGRVREKLRDGVEAALKVFGNGFLAHPANTRLRDRLRSGERAAEAYYRQLLRLVYRLLFLMVAEERGLVVNGATSASTSVYQRHYSISRLRTLAEQTLTSTQRHSDLWLGLLSTFRLFERDGVGTPLGISGLDGDLFGPSAIPDLEDTHLSNGVLVAAMRHLSLYEERSIRRRVNYAALDVEELGSVYESLLDYRPVVMTLAGESSFDLVSGSDRKTTGSYYTRPELVQELIKSALEPVMEERLKAAATAAERERALLSLKVCDPACGSGAFLLAAARRIGRELARARTGEAEPTPEQFRLAVRDVISHCIYGVDMNPLAVDLCKVALWLEGHWRGKPLGFLDHRIKCGNSLIGLLDPDLLSEGIPDEAFSAVTGDVKAVAAAVRKQNRQGRSGQKSFEGLSAQVLDRLGAYPDHFRKLLRLEEESTSQVQEKARQYTLAREGASWWRDWTTANLWAGAFFASLTDADDPALPTHERFIDYLERGKLDGRLAGQVNGLAVRNRFFHWHLEFPEVFGDGGFDVVLGNPPWERIKLQEEEHWVDDPYVTGAPNKAERARRIESYRASTDPAWRERVARFDAAKHDAEAQSKFFRKSGRFPLTAVGDVNTYALFSELARQLLHPRGRAGIIVPTGIATDDTTKAFLGDLVRAHSLESFFGFKNERHLFAKPVEHYVTFGCLTILGCALKAERMEFCWLAYTIDEKDDPARRIVLTPGDLERLNPNTRTCPVFRTRADADLTSYIYKQVPILGNERTGENAWALTFNTMLHMANDSGLFSTQPGPGMVPLYEAKMIHQYDHRFGSYASRGEERGFVALPQTRLEDYKNPDYLVQPFYWVPEEEVVFRTSLVPASLIQAVRLKSEKAVGQTLCLWLAGYHMNRGNDEGAEHAWKHFWASCSDSTPQLFADWLLAGPKAKRIEEEYPLTDDDLAVVQSGKDLLTIARELIWQRRPGWLLAFRDIARSTDIRTAIFTVLPCVGIGHTVPVIQLGASCGARQYACILANFNSLVFDYVVRQKLGGVHLTYTVLRQLPVLDAGAYTDDEVEFVVERVLQLVYTAWDLQPFARDLGYNGPPFQWDEEQRTHLRVQLDAFFFHKYGLSRKQTRYVLDPCGLTDNELKEILDPTEDPTIAPRTKGFPGETFRVLQQSEVRLHGEYRSRDLVLFYYKAWQDGAKSQFNRWLSPRVQAPRPRKTEAPGVVEPAEERRLTGTGG